MTPSATISNMGCNNVIIRPNMFFSIFEPEIRKLEFNQDVWFVHSIKKKNHINPMLRSALLFSSLTEQQNMHKYRENVRTDQSLMKLLINDLFLLMKIKENV